MQNHKSQPPMTPRSSSARGGRNAGISKSSTSNASGNNSDAVIPGPGRLRLTAARKQALIENVRLEVTERARNLRAMYALQTKDLHCRIERRVNRIPVALRKMEMQELVARHEETKK